MQPVLKMRITSGYVMIKFKFNLFLIFFGALPAMGFEIMPCLDSIYIRKSKWGNTYECRKTPEALLCEITNLDSKYREDYGKLFIYKIKKKNKEQVSLNRIASFLNKYSLTNTKPRWLEYRNAYPKCMANQQGRESIGMVLRSSSTGLTSPSTSYTEMIQVYDMPSYILLIRGSFKITNSRRFIGQLGTNKAGSKRFWKRDSDPKNVFHFNLKEVPQNNYFKLLHLGKGFLSGIADSRFSRQCTKYCNSTKKFQKFLDKLYKEHLRDLEAFQK